MIVRLKNFSCLLLENNRSKAYLEKMILNGFVPEKLYYLKLSKLPHKNQEENGDSIIACIDSSFKNRKYYLYDNQKNSLVGELKKPAKYATFSFHKTVAEIISEHQLTFEIIEAASINDSIVIERIQEDAFKYVLFCGGGILRSEILSAGPKFIHIHPGLLPQVRGSMAIEWSILLNNKCAATAFIMSQKIDEGAIIAAQEFAVPELEYGYIPALYSSHIRSELLLEIVKLYSGQGDFDLIDVASVKSRMYYKMHPAISEMVLNKLLIKKKVKV